MASQDVDSIVRSIARGMRGKPSKDFKYLHQMAKKYKDHPMYMEILRACYRLMRKSLPDDMRERFDDEDAQKGVSHTSVGVPSALAEAHEKQRCSDTSAAEEILSTAIQYWEKIHEEGAFQDDDAMEYRDFPNLMEEALYFARYAPKKRNTNPPRADFFSILGVWSTALPLGSLGGSEGRIGDGKSVESCLDRDFARDG